MSDIAAMEKRIDKLDYYADLNPHIDFTKIEKGSPGIHSGELVIISGATKKKKNTVSNEADWAEREAKHLKLFIEALQKASPKINKKPEKPKKGKPKTTELKPFVHTFTAVYKPDNSQKKKPMTETPKPDLKFNRARAVKAARNPYLLRSAFDFHATKEGYDYWFEIYDNEQHTPESLQKLQNMIIRFDKGTLK